MRIGERLNKGWNAFMNKDPTEESTRVPNDYVYFGTANPGTVRVLRGNDQSMVDALINKIANDVAHVELTHCKLDGSDRYEEKIPGPITNCLEVEANVDQAATAFRIDLVSSILDWGVAAIVPVETEDPEEADPNYYAERKTIPVCNMRVGRIVQWAPQQVQLSVYNEKKGQRQDIWMDKRAVCIIENPFYDVMNRPNSALRRLKTKLALSDIIDEQSADPNKFNLIVQMPYSIKTPAKEKIAQDRIAKLEKQLSKSQYGIGYIDATEHVTQLNRALDNRILESVEYYWKMLLDQLGLTLEILNGSASEEVMNNYYTRIIEPILVAICEEIKRKFLSKTARSQKQSIEFYRDPFKLVPVTQMPELADKVTRNEIMTSNEVRQGMGMRPSKDPSADELRNKNLSPAKDEEHVDIDGKTFSKSQQKESNKEEIQNGK